MSKGGQLLPVTVSTGLSNGIMTAVTSGIEEGEEVATGYSVSAPAMQGGPEGEQSPFAPKPPSRNKKK